MATRFSVIHHRRWKRPNNHLDGRVCPTCSATVHGDTGQAKHDAWHQAMNDLLGQVSARAGITEEDYVVPATWTAVAVPDDDAYGGDYGGDYDREEIEQ